MSVAACVTLALCLADTKVSDLKYIFSGAAPGELYGATYKAAYRLAGDKLEFISEIADTERIAGTDVLCQPVCVMNAFRSLVPPKGGGPFDITPPYLQSDISRNLLGIERGVVFTSRDDTLFIDYQPEPFSVIKRWALTNDLVPFEATVSRDRRRVLLCFYPAEGKPGGVMIGVGELTSREMKYYGRLGVDGILLGAEFLNDSEIAFLYGWPGNNWNDHPRYGKFDFEGTLSILSLKTGKVRTSQKIPLHNRERYMASYDSDTVAILGRTNIYRVTSNK